MNVVNHGYKKDMGGMAEKFAPDEFDNLPKARKVGVHRSTKRGFRDLKIIIVALVVTIVVVALAYGAFQIISNRANFIDTSTPSPTASESAEPTATSASPSPIASGAPSPSPSAAAVDAKSLQISMFNGSTRAGLAAKTAATLKSQGYQVAVNTNTPAAYKGKSLSYVYYTTPDQAQAAAEIAQALGIPTSQTQQAAVSSTPISVVLGSSY